MKRKTQAIQLWCAIEQRGLKLVDKGASSSPEDLFQRSAFSVEQALGFWSVEDTSFPRVKKQREKSNHLDCFLFPLSFSPFFAFQRCCVVPSNSVPRRVRANFKALRALLALCSFKPRRARLASAGSR